MSPKIARTTSARAAAGLPRGVVVCGREAPDRFMLERFVTQRYAQAYRARLRDFLPVLLGIEGCDGELLGVIGARRASHFRPLFLETYLDAPVERLLSICAGRHVRRSCTAEVGNLASAVPGGNRMLVTTFANYLEVRGIEWAVFTATLSLRNGFERIGAQLVDLGPADPGRLPVGCDDWGSYYDTDPRVTATSVAGLVRAAARDPAAAARFAHLWMEARTAGGAAVGKVPA